ITMTVTFAEPDDIARDSEEESQQGEDIDERRLNRRAYDYLCRLLEVRNWLRECLKESEDSDLIPPVTDLETILANGVLLARLGNSFAPESVPWAKIFDKEQTRYREKHLEYRHTDNIMLWRRAMESVRLPEIFIPETVDVYEGRNMKTIFCLYALAFHLYRMRKAPPIRNQAGMAVFSGDEMARMREHLKDSKVPEFGDVGGILSDKRLSSDEASLMEALRAIATAISNKDAPALLSALQCHDAGILYVEPNLGEEYLSEFSNNHEEELTKASVQNGVIQANNAWAESRLDNLLCVEGQIVDRSSLYTVFDALQIEQTREKAFPLYIQLLLGKRTKKVAKLTREEIQRIVEEANALVEVKIAAEHGSSLDSLSALSNQVLELNTTEENAKLYHSKLQFSYHDKDADFFLLKEDLAAVVAEFSTLSETDRLFLELRAAFEKDDREVITAILTQLGDSNDFRLANLDFYVEELKQKPESLNADRLPAVIRAVNEECEKELAVANKLIDVNKAIRSGSNPEVEEKIRDAAHLILPGSFNEDVVGNYVDAVCQKAGDKKKKEELQDTIDENDEEEEDDELPPPPKVVEHFHHSFRLGGFWVETEERTWSPSRKQPEMDGALSKEEFVTSIIVANTRYERALADEKQRDEEEEAARKIQENYRRYMMKRDTSELKSADAPSLRLVRKFVTYLQDKDYDRTDELEIEKSKARVTNLVVANQRLDRDLTDLDEKIGLLVRNRINLQDVIADKNKIRDEEAARLNREGSLRRKNQLQAETLEQMFYHLQTDPAYIVNLLEARNSAELERVIASTVAPSFGFLTERREEFLMAKLLCEIVRRDLDEITKPDDLFSSRRTPLMAALLNDCVFDSINDRVCDVLVDEMKAFFATEKRENQAFNLDPIDVYVSMYGGVKPGDAQTALEDKRVAEVLEESKSFLAEWSERFSAAIIAKHQIPRSVKYVILFTADELRRRFPSAPLADQQKAVAELAYEAWVRPSLVNTRHISIATGKETTDDGMAKMVAVTKFMQYAVANRGYGNAKWYLSSLNRQIHIINQQFKNFVMESISSVKYLDEIYDGLSEYTHYDPARRPVLALPGRTIVDVINSVKQNAAPMTVAPSAKPFRALIESLNAATVDDDKTLVLYLHPMSSSSSYEDEEKAAQARKVQEEFVNAKRFIVDLLLCGCVGSSIPELLEFRASREVESCHERLFNDQPKFENIAAKQTEIGKLLDSLESSNRVNSDNAYQDLVTDIANDIRLATARRKERTAQRKSLEESEGRLRRQRDELAERLNQYEVYLDTCLENLSKTTRRISILSTTEKAGKISKARTSADTRQHHKSTVEKLFRKGVLVDNKIAGAENTRRAAKWTVEFSRSERKGVFEVRVLDGKEPLGEYTVDFQDLLQAQYRSEKHYAVKNSLVFSLNELIAHINKKFYGQ
ncbi:hypothetical protein PENTCL1PPCAC_23675, partial [Pristionchus entomophagus]